MSENSKIEWTDHINLLATGRQLGGYKSAARKVGCTIQQWMANRIAGKRHCFTCREWKPREVFTVDRSRLGGLAARCKPCMSEASTASRHRITVAELAKFRDEHGNRCGICSATELVYVDHDHSTGVMRGLLCPSCNSAIGLLHEDYELFAAAVAYLKRESPVSMRVREFPL